MNLPMQGEQQPQQQVKPFPASKAEALKFSNDLLEVMFNNQVYNNNLKQLESAGEKDRGQIVGMMSGYLVGNRVADVRGQTGRPIQAALVAQATKGVIDELASMAKDHKIFEMKNSEKKEALGIAVKILDNMAKGGGQPQQPQQQQQVPTPQQPSGGM